MSKKNKQDIDSLISSVNKLHKFKSRLILGVIITVVVAVIIAFLIIVIGSESQDIIDAYNNISGPPHDSKQQFGTKNVKITVTSTGKLEIELVTAKDKDDNNVTGTSDSDPGTPEGDNDSGGSGGSGDDSGGGGIAPPVEPTSELKDVLAKIWKESNSEEGYLAALSCVCARANGSTDPTDLYNIMAAPNQFEGYVADAAYNSVSSAHQSAIDRFIKGERLTNYKYFVGPAGAYDIYAIKGSTVFSIGVGDNYYSEQYKGTRATNSNPDSSKYVKIYDRSSKSEVNCSRKGYIITVNN